MPVRGGWRLTAVLAGAFLWSNQEQVGFSQTPDRCVLAGTVLNSATSAGIPHALVSYVGTNSGYRFTDAGGNFQIANVPCVSYSLTVSKPGFVSGQEETPRPGQLFKSINLAALDTESTDQSGCPSSSVNITVDLERGSRPARIPLV